ncbi:MAG: DNA-binding response regulator [Acidobacteria bacterium]|nr:DNA-binding response regulator [Acidobacteriota bacterium]
MSTAKVRILLAEDHETVRAGLKLIVNSQPDMEVVGEATDGRSAIAQAEKLLPDIVLMDISMPQLNGLKATEKLKESRPEIKVLTLTRHKDDGYLQQLLRAGASGYVLKQSPPSELLHAIRAIVAGGKYLDPAVAGKVMGTYSGRQSATTSGKPQESLSDREEEVLRLIAWGHSNKEIGARLEISVKTVEVHKANCMKKLGMRSRIDIVRYALLQGWLQDT